MISKYLREGSRSGDAGDTGEPGDTGKFGDADDSGFEQLLTVTFEKDLVMRYGENPHQSAALYRDAIPVPGALTTAVKLHGKELSYNNLNDADCVLEALREFDEPAAVAVKHGTPCGVAVGADVFEAYKAAHDSDPESIYGGIVAVNRKIDLKTADEMSKIFLEIVIAPDFDNDTFELLSRKKNIRLLKLDTDAARRNYLEHGGHSGNIFFKKISGGLLVQSVNTATFDAGKLKVVTKRAPTEKELSDLSFAMAVVKHAKSNAIVLAKNMATVGIGAGQTSRVMATKVALEYAGERAGGAVLASDAFFPFGDCAEAAAANGVTAIIQPGGSKNDQMTVDVCDKHGIAMVFTGMRHFKH
jgi:phosphoribosylaminoimidazolecarboxamide formyltransferase/IMP cyclohydrolase